MEITDGLESWQREKVVPLQDHWIFDLAADLQFPGFERDVGLDPQIEYGKLVTCRWQGGIRLSTRFSG
jgi:hypothetical protein